MKKLKVIYLLLEINFKDMPFLFLCQHATQNFYSIITDAHFALNNQKEIANSPVVRN
jgi:hypothetical protein